MQEMVIKQADFYRLEECQSKISNIENKYRYKDECDYFGTLVNFSTAKTEPYQRWVRYREGYSTALVNELIDRADVNPETHFIADPMVGSGTTIIASKKRGFDAFGVDVNPYCKLIANAKLAQPSAETIAAVNAFLHSLPSAFRSTSYENPPLSEYFPEDNLLQLLALKEKIDKHADCESKAILNACWFFILEACSNRKKDGNGLATRPAPVRDVIEHFKSVVGELIKDYVEHPFKKCSQTSVFTGTACQFANFANEFETATAKKLGAIIFSPPYANAFDYYESYKMELLFGGLYSPSDYQVHKKEQIRNYRISYGKVLTCEYPAVESICNEINDEIPRKEARLGKKDARTRLMPNMLRAYFTDMGNVLSELYSALDHDGHCYIVVDQSAYVGVIVPTDIILADIAEQKGFTVEEIIICRSASTSAQQRNAYPYLGTTLRESIVCLKK